MSTPSVRPRRSVVAAAAGVLVAAACGSSRGGAGGSSTSPSAGGSASGAPDLSGVTLTIGDQANGLKTLLTAAGTLAGTPYTVKFAE